MAVDIIYSRSSASHNTDDARRDIQLIQRTVSMHNAPTFKILPVSPELADRKFGWTMDNFADVSAITGVEEDSAYPTATTSLVETAQNTISLFTDAYGTTSLARALTTLAKEGPEGHQRMHCFDRLMRKTDVSMLWSTYNAGAASNAYQTSGIIETAVVTGAFRNAAAAATWAGNTLPVAYCATAVNVAATLTLANLNSNLRAFYLLGNNLGEGYVMMYGTRMASVINNILVGVTSGLYTRPLDVGKIGGEVKFIQSDWGLFPVMLNHHMDQYTSLNTIAATGPTGTTYDLTANGNQDVLIFRPDDVRQRWVPEHRFNEEMLSVSGLTHNIGMRVAYGLEYRNPRTMCLLLDVN